ncbi:VOC family protein [Devosia sp.]|uniref:VOC family protein n=1 Tax=Devosia sp. TaxID=1871048 RepID=UPI001AC4F5F0|nr:VOC family protein [Devosia sp.]MBN9332795.1 VOC family protein [Devosia sp.]
MPINRRHLLRLAGAATASAALTGALRAEGGSFSILSEYDGLFATSTPLHVRDVTLRVRDVELMTRFYSEILGLSVLETTAETTLLGVDGITLLTLEHRPDAPIEPPTEAGLYHTAFLMPSRAELARWLVHTAMAQYQFSGFADHRVSEAVYLDDPEGNGIEVYADRAPELWSWNGDTVIMGTEAIDFDSLLALTDTENDTFSGAPSGMRIGHIHLRAGNIEEARTFYAAALGLDITSGHADAVFLSSGRYHHHVALNTWQSAGAGQRNPQATGLAGFNLLASDQSVLDAAKARLSATGIEINEGAANLAVSDPWGTGLAIVLGA